jgi:hypothetical protein
MMQATRGDRIIVTAAKTGGATREGEILEVIEGEFRIRYRVQWADGHETLFAPGPGAAAVIPRPKATAKKPTAKKPSGKPTAKKPTTKKQRG